MPVLADVRVIPESLQVVHERLTATLKDLSATADPAHA